MYYTDANVYHTVISGYSYLQNSPVHIIKTFKVLQEACPTTFDHDGVEFTVKNLLVYNTASVT